MHRQTKKEKLKHETSAELKRFSWKMFFFRDFHFNVFNCWNTWPLELEGSCFVLLLYVIVVVPVLIRDSQQLSRALVNWISIAGNESIFAALFFDSITFHHDVCWCCSPNRILLLLLSSCKCSILGERSHSIALTSIHPPAHLNDCRNSRRLWEVILFFSLVLTWKYRNRGKREISLQLS